MAGAERDHDARERLLSALAGGSSVSGAATASGYSRKHVQTLLKDGEFVALLEERRGAKDRGEFERASKVGLKVLLEIAQDDQAPHAARVSAARALMAADAARPKPAAAIEIPGSGLPVADPTPEQLQAALRVLA